MPNQSTQLQNFLQNLNQQQKQSLNTHEYHMITASINVNQEVSELLFNCFLSGLNQENQIKILNSNQMNNIIFDLLLMNKQYNNNFNGLKTVLQNRWEKFSEEEKMNILTSDKIYEKDLRAQFTGNYDYLHISNLSRLVDNLYEEKYAGNFLSFTSAQGIHQNNQEI